MMIEREREGGSELEQRLKEREREGESEFERRLKERERGRDRVNENDD